MRFLSLFLLFAGLLVYPLASIPALGLFLLTSRQARRWPLPLPTLTVAGAALISALVSAWRGRALVGAVGVGVMAALYLLLASRVRPADARAAALGLVVGVFASLARAAWQVTVQGQDQATLFTFHPNLAGASLLLAGGGLAMLLPHLRGRVDRALVALALLADLAALLYTGSRSALLGLAVGAALLGVVGVGLLVVQPRRWRHLVLALALVAALAVGVGAAAAVWWTPAPKAGNLLPNSSFSHGDVGWHLGTGAALVEGGASGAAVRLEHDRSGFQVLLEPAGWVAVRAGEPVAVSLDVRPEAGGVGAFLRLEALDGRGRFLARAGAEGWTTGDEWRAGGRLRLPQEPAGVWQRFAVVSAPTPEGTAYVRLMLAADGAETGPYGDVGRLQLSVGAETPAYVEGPSPALREYLDATFGAARTRLMALQTPFATSGGRVALWRLSLELAAHKPFLGYGFGSSEHLFAPVASRLLANPLGHPHNFFLQLLLDGGSLTLVAFVLWVGAALGVAWRRRSWNGVTLTATTAAIFVANLFDGALAQSGVAALLAAVVALGGGLGDEG